jgi:hypothetical protein
LIFVVNAHLFRRCFQPQAFNASAFVPVLSILLVVVLSSSLKMKLSFAATMLAVLASVQLLLAEVTVLKTVQVIYDKSPKLRIRGSGFDAQDHDISLELAATGQPSLVTDKDFMITKDADGDGIILKLLGNRR